jgi:molybdenum cofactor cytidylyltransferase
LLADLRGRPLVAWAVDEARSADLDETIVVVGAEADLVARSVSHLAVTVVDNADWAGGIATSLSAAVRHATEAGHDGLVVGLGDQPFIEAEAWRRVADSLRSGASMAVATYGGARRNPVGLASMVWSDLPTEGDEGARVVMRLRPELVSEIPCPGRPFDIDTVEELDRWS